jgi:branched-chain amino acid transport system ATP-binding protein
MSVMLSVQGLKVSYGEIEVLHGIDLQVCTGEIVALVGANGAGKSTTLAAICGLVPATAGHVVYGELDVSGWPPEKLSRCGMALTPEGRRVFANLTVAENLRLGGAMHLGRRAGERQEELLDLFPVLRNRLAQKAGNLSGGEQQMLAIARSLMSKPKLLLLDEPSLGLSPQMIDTVFDLIASLSKSGLTILLVEQNVALALEIATSAIVLANGAVALAGPANELGSSALVRQAYLGA